MDMIKKNIFRPLPNANRGNALAVSETGVEEEEQEPDKVGSTFVEFMKYSYN